MKYKAVFKVDYRGSDPESGDIKDQTGRHSIEFDAPTGRVALDECSHNSSQTLVQLRSVYMGMTNVEIELLELYRLEPIDLSAFRPTISIV